MSQAPFDPAPRHFRRLSPLLAAALLAGAWLAPAPELSAQPVGIEEEDLDETAPAEMGEDPPFAASVDEEALEELFATGEALFESEDQGASLQPFGQVIGELEAALSGGELSGGGLSDRARTLLARSYSFRAQVSFNFGDSERVEDDLRRMLEVQPWADLERDLVSPKLVDQFDALRRELVGDISFVAEPLDMEVTVDGLAVDVLAGALGVLAGTRRVVARRPGYTPLDQEIEVEAGKSASFELTLERTSAVIRLNTRPSGCEVRLDGSRRGTTEGSAPEGFLPEGSSALYRREEFSDELVLTDVELGLRELEIRRDGYRPYRAELMIDDLLDYPIPPVVLEQQSGTLVFLDLPREAEIRVDDRPVRVDNPGSSRPRLTLPPGEHAMTISEGRSRMFSTHLRLADRQTMEVAVRMRPGLAFLGVLGGDPETARNLDQALRVTLGKSGKWTLLDRTAAGRRALGTAGVDAAALRAAEARRVISAGEGIDWQALQQRIDAEAPGLVYVVAVPENDLVASAYTLWIWPAAPGPPRPDRVRLPLREPRPLEQLAESFNRQIELRRPWVGALLIDSDGAPHPLVAEVAPGSPAEAAGLTAGDQVMGVSQVPVLNRAAFDERIAAAETGEVLDIAVRGPGGARVAKLTLGAGPIFLSRRTPDLLDSVAFSELLLMEEEAAEDDRWILRVNQALILMRAHRWQQAARTLGNVRAPQRSHGVSQATVDYWLGLALSESGPEYLDNARTILERAAKAEGARLDHNDGPFLAPRAQARIRALGGG